MDALDVFMERLRGFGAAPAMHLAQGAIDYDTLNAQIDTWRARFAEHGAAAGSVVAVHGDFSPQSSAALLALFAMRAIAVPLTALPGRQLAEFMDMAGVALEVWPEETRLQPRIVVAEPDLVKAFRLAREPGLIVFSSGSSGKPKGILQNVERVLRKFVTRRPAWRTVMFLMFDHFGGINTFLSTFAYGGTAVFLPSRNPHAVARVIAEAKATLLPTTPTFLNLLLGSGAYLSHDLSSIRLITYGTEVMPEETLRRAREAFPNAVLKQTYGLSELGVLRSQSEAEESLWVKIGGEGFETKVVDGQLYIRSEANMVGYLNAPNPFDADGWMATGDEVEVRGDYIRILGRQSDLINVGGQKVFPSEVEQVLLAQENVGEASVFGVKHPIMGQAVQARISLLYEEAPDAVISRLRKACLQSLARYKVPIRFLIADQAELASDRFKKLRRDNANESN